ncbi:hypothetical protein [Lapillicoccus jejuensis]|uniref:hypothetical protein n=1 Tax=Lapillicoccus jejuensis TaxID=402171 RepID=UPI001150A72B|nr:hypothetical protein [Lapillicoccus jejuensis]
MTPQTLPLGRPARRLAAAGAAALALTALTGTTAGAIGPRPVSGQSPVSGTGSGPTVDGGTLGSVGGTTYPSAADPGWVPVTAAPPAAGLTALPVRIVRVATTAQLTAALAAPRPGDRIELATGTYAGPVTLKGSGTADHPVVVAAAAGATPVIATPNQRYPSCGATGPDEDKTLSFMQGASHWVLTGLTIRGGVKISSLGADEVQNWQKAMINTHNWAARRGVPGASYPANPAASRTLRSYFAGVTGKPLAPTQDIQLLGNTLTGKGVFGRFSEWGVIAGNTITDIACGTGPALWLANYSHGNLIADNDVSHVATSTASHYMQEGIRLGNGSDYNVVAGNKVHDLDRNGRAFTTDQDSSFNLFTSNVADNVTIGFNEQQSGWGNTWTLNVANRASSAAFSFRMEDVRLAAPSKDTSSYYTVVTCNIATNSAVDLQAGAMAGATFRGNSFGRIAIGQALAGYWSGQGDRWNDTSLAPRSTPSGSAPAATGC